MMDIIFAMTRYMYDSYVDFWKLVELSGFETCYVDEVDISKPRVYIVTPMNGEWEPHIRNQLGKVHNAHLVHWCLERPSGAYYEGRPESGGLYNYAKSNRSKIYERTLDDIWISDRGMADEIKFHHIVLGSDYGLGTPSDDKIYDFCHMSYLVGRRSHVYGQLNDVTIGPNCWPPDRDYVLKRSRFALNIHQDQFPFQEPLRLALFAAYGLPILTEEIHDAYPWSEEFMVFNPYDGIAGRLRQMLGNDYTRWRDMGLKARDRMCKEFRFRDTVIEAVKEYVG